MSDSLLIALGVFIVPGVALLDALIKIYVDKSLQAKEGER